jgi:hypothetical protein
VLIEEAVELARERRRGFMSLLSRPLDNLGWAALLGDELGRARSQFGENLALSKERGDKGTLLMSLEGLACVAGAEGEPYGPRGSSGRPRRSWRRYATGLCPKKGPC